ncbi:MAG: hypothetical protein FWF05_01205 [Oscillospiraceae bacterium]|nr:hypothetical protein [Oscillospiraceae bacterium]
MKKKIFIITLALAAVAFIAVVIFSLLSTGGGNKPSGLKLLAAESTYSHYEIRNREAYLFYTVTLSNETGEKIEHAKLCGTFKADFASGFILKEDAFAKAILTGQETFFLEPGERVTLHLAFMASYYKNSGSPSRELPVITLFTPEEEIIAELIK